MRATKLLNLSTLIYVYLRSLLFKPYQNRVTFKCPEKVGDYKIVSSLEKIGTVKPFDLAIYKNSSGKKAIAKIWSGPLKDYNYYALQNEYLLYEILTKVTTRISKNLPPEFTNVKVPKVIVKQEYNNQLIVLIEYVDGEVAIGLSNKRKIEIYFKIVNFLDYLGTKLTKRERQLISARTSKDYIFLYPLLIIKAVLTHPRAFLPLVKGIPVFINSIPVLLSEDTRPLVHRDLHFRNILVGRKNQIYLIDLQLCALTLKLQENITTLRYLWKEGDFYKYLLKEIKQRYSKNKNFKKLFKGLAVNSGTHGLTGSDFTKRKINLFIDFLNFGIDFK